MGIRLRWMDMRLGMGLWAVRGFGRGRMEVVGLMRGIGVLLGICEEWIFVRLLMLGQVGYFSWGV